MSGVVFNHHGITFFWDSNKALANVIKHEAVSFELAVEIFFDPFVKTIDQQEHGGETRNVIVGMTNKWQHLLVACVELEDEAIRIISARKVEPWKDAYMKINKLRERLSKDRPMTTISIRMPQDVINDLKKVAPRLGFSGYQSLLRAYVGRGLRVDIELLEKDDSIDAFANILIEQGVDKNLIDEALKLVGT